MGKCQIVAIKLLTCIVLALIALNMLIITSQNRTRDGTVIFREVLKQELSDSETDSSQPNDEAREKFIRYDEIKSSGVNDVVNLSDVTINKPKDAAEEYDMKDDVIDGMIARIRAYSSAFFPSYYATSSLYNLTQQLGSTKRKLAKQMTYYKEHPSKPVDPNWEKAHRNIRQFSLYDSDDPVTDGLLQDLATLPIAKTEENKGGTEFKLTLHLSDGGRAIMKPMRWVREVEANPNHYIFDDMERHIAEIAAFQLDRILGFFRVPPTIGRRINITSELRKIVPKSVSKTIFNSPSMFAKAYWETKDDLCDKIRTQHPYNNGKLLADMIDSHTFDFLTGNKDRHSFLFFKEFGNYSFPIMYDNGRGFGRKTYDAMSILAPLRQCCLIRKSTLLKFIKIYEGPEKLSDLMEKALASDPVAPVLIRGHLTALDRRLLIILRTVAKCLETRSLEQVIADDDF